MRASDNQISQIIYPKTKLMNTIQATCTSKYMHHHCRTHREALLVVGLKK